MRTNPDWLKEQIASGADYAAALEKTHLSFMPKPAKLSLPFQKTLA